jgi:hypothetical protein
MVVLARKNTETTVSILCYEGGIDYFYDDRKKVFCCFEIKYLDKNIPQILNCLEIIDCIVYKNKWKNKIEFGIWSGDENEGEYEYEHVIIKHFELYCNRKKKKKSIIKRSINKNITCFKLYIEGKKARIRRITFDYFMIELAHIYRKIDFLEKKKEKNRTAIKLLIKKREMIEEVLNVYEDSIFGSYYSKKAMHDYRKSFRKHFKK